MACDNVRGMPDIGADDSAVNHVGQSYLAGALPQYFGMRNWGEDAAPSPVSPTDEPEWGRGRTKAQWSGILGISADMLPWVGRLPEKVSGRALQKRSDRLAESVDEKASGAQVAPPGEWIAAGYTGEGMVHAWMSGKALASMVLDREDEIASWFPSILRINEKRWKEANIEDMFAKYFT